MQARKQKHIFSLNNLEEKTLSNSNEYFLFILSVLSFAYQVHVEAHWLPHH